MAGAGSKASASSDDTVKRVRRTKPSMLDGQTMIGLIDNWADFRSRYNLHGWRAGNTPEASAPSLDQKKDFGSRQLQTNVHVSTSNWVSAGGEPFAETKVGVRFL